MLYLFVIECKLFSNVRKVGVFIKYLFSKKIFSRYLIFIGLLNVLTGLIPVLYLHIFAQMIELVSEKNSFENFVSYSLFLIIIIVSLPIINDYSSIFETLYNKQLKKMLVISTNIYYEKTDLLEIQLDKFQNKFVFIQSTDSLIRESYYLLFSSIRSLVTFFWDVISFTRSFHLVFHSHFYRFLCIDSTKQEDWKITVRSRC